MSFVYEDQGSSAFVVYHVDPAEEIDSMSLGMLTNNCIPGFAPASFFQKDADKYIKYNVTGKVTAAQMFQGPVNKKRLTGFLQGIVDAMIAAEEYMLDQNTVELNLENIYMDPVTCETVVLCIPVFREENASIDLALFLKNIVFNTQFDQTENTDHVAKIFNCLGAGSKLVLEDLKQLLNQLQGQNGPVKVAPVVQPAAQPTIQPTVQQTGMGNQPSVRSGSAGAAVQPYGGEAVSTAQKPAGIPGSGPVYGGANAPVPPAAKTEPAAGEKPMSTWYLLNHMSKENMAIYKAQQAQAKEKNQKEKPAKGVQKKSASAKGPQKKAGPVKREQPSFAFPGGPAAPVAPAFDIPGQESASAKKQVSAALDLPPVEKVEQKPVQHTAASINFGATTVLGAEPGGTTVLTPPREMRTPTLIRKATGERVAITKQIFTIGIESYVDYRIGGNSAVSRSHAKIIIRGNEYFLMDTNSTNGTYVNGERIKKNVEVRIEDGSKIVFANDEFDFQVC